VTAPLVLSLGDPAGVGPEIVVKAWETLRESGPAFVVVGDRAALEAAGAPAIRLVADPAAGAAAFDEALPLIDLPLDRAAVPGDPTSDSAARVIQWIESATGLVLSGAASGLVTAPIAKSYLYAAGFGFPGHTEFLGELAPPVDRGDGVGPVMLLTARDLRVSLVTIHEPLARVPDLLTIEKIVNAGLVTAAALRNDFAVERARVAVCGLNPHAGEDGALGREEVEIVRPAVAALRARGVDATGPHPSDSLFHDEARGRYDAALCLYHDQALIPVKMLDFWGGVNVTLGLPIVRTSPDHGTGFDIAGKGVAKPDSLIAAIRLAAEIAQNRQAHRAR
jgi:4-hydroxythreonine-4-phosphate dehydrogenase